MPSRRRSRAKAKATAESKADADEEARQDLGERRRKAEAEAAAIRAMMSAPKKVLVAPAGEAGRQGPEPGKPAIKGTLHKPPARRARAPGAPAAAGAPGAGKEVKSAKLSSSWEGRRRQEEGHSKTRGAPGRRRPQFLARRPAWPPRQRPRPHDRIHLRGADRAAVIEVHVPETITVAELAHKMASRRPR
jgi:translation initiation factor IF-2